MNVLDLFSGIGGFSLGLERAGMRTVAFCEIEPYCRRVLAKHWPGVPIYDDVCTLTAERLVRDGIGPIDVICGGFPCQDISVAGKGAGIEGKRSGLWSEYRRLIRELRPEYVVVENVSALLGRGLDRVLGDLAAIRYDAEWHCVPAAAIGALHRRDRIWIVAYPAQEPMADASRYVHPEQEARGAERQRTRTGCESGTFSDANNGRFTVRWEPQALAHPLLNPSHLDGCEAWLVEPDVGRVADGVPNRVDRLRALGNAVVPQIPEIIGRAIMRAVA